MPPKRTHSFSARFSSEVIDLLNARSERLGQSRARVAERLIEEGLQSEEFPGIVFRDGPAGRRAGIAGGPDVWEIMRDLKLAVGEGLSDPVSAVVSGTDLHRSTVQLAANYYAAHPQAVDERIQLDEQWVERVHRALSVVPAA
jgi:hypothetical protein